MEINQEAILSYGIMFLLCLVIGIVCFFGKKKNGFLSFCLHGFLAVGLLVLAKNTEMLSQWIDFSVSVTPFHLCACFCLGIPGLILLYGIGYMNHM